MSKKYLTLAVFLGLTRLLASATQPSVSLQISAPVQDNAYQVTAGQPFQLIVTVQDAERNTGKPVIHGIEKCSVLGVSQSSSMTLHDVHNVRSMRSTNTYVYTVVMPNKGPFELGPALVPHAHKKIASNTVSLIAQESPPKSAAKVGASSSDPVIIQVTAPKQSLVVGEPVIVTLLFYIHGQIRPQGLAIGAAPDALFKELPDGPIRQEVHNGIAYQVQEKRYLYTPLQAGSLRIEPTTLQYLAPAHRQRRRSGFGVFEDDFFQELFGGGLTQHSVVSDPLVFTVNPLPPAPAGSPVQGIASIDKLSLQLERGQVATQEPLLLTLTVEGKGDLDRLIAPALKVPAAIKWYESKNSVQLRSAHDPCVGTKQFQYVLQPQQQGSWQIAMDPLQVYDPAKGEYVTHAIEPVTLAVAQGLHAVAPVDAQMPVGLSTEANNKAAQEISGGNDIHHIMHEWQEDSGMPQTIPWMLFWSLVGGMTVGMLLWAWYVSRMHRVGRVKKQRFDKAFITVMQKKLNNLIQQESSCELHQFFIEFLSAKLHMPQDDLADETIMQQLTQRGFDAKKVDEFMHFLNHCASLRFGAGHTVSHDTLLKQAQRWFVLLGS